MSRYFSIRNITYSGAIPAFFTTLLQASLSNAIWPAILEIDVFVESASRQTLTKKTLPMRSLLSL
jgi:hypothetical protein